MMTQTTFEARLDAAAMDWVGTPWRPNGRQRGVGASCHHAVAGVLRDAGCSIPDVPDGPADWASHQSDSMQAAWLDRHPESFRAVDMSEIQPGDVVGFQLGNCIHHLGLILPGGKFFQCLRPAATVLSQSEPLFVRRAKRAWRPIR